MYKQLHELVTTFDDVRLVREDVGVERVLEYFRAHQAGHTAVVDILVVVAPLVVLVHEANGLTQNGMLRDHSDEGLKNARREDPPIAQVGFPVLNRRHEPDTGWDGHSL